MTIGASGWDTPSTAGPAANAQLPNSVIFTDALGIQKGDSSILGFDETTRILSLLGTRARFQGDFSDATINHRLAFQTSLANSPTAVGAVPSGSSAISSFRAYSATNPNNSSFIELKQSGATESQILASKAGTGVYAPLVFYTSDIERARFRAGGGFEIVADSVNAIGVYLRGRSSDGIGVLGFYNNAGSVENGRIQGNPDSSLIFSTGSSAAERMRINSNGRFETIADSNAHNFAARARAADDFSQIIFTNNAGSTLRGAITVDSGNNITFSTNSSAQNQFAILNTAASVRTLNVTGAIATGNPKISASAGSLDIGSPVVFTAQTTATSATAGGATALPATPLGYLTSNINGTAVKIPYYNT